MEQERGANQFTTETKPTTILKYQKALYSHFRGNAGREESLLNKIGENLLKGRHTLAGKVPSPLPIHLSSMAHFDHDDYKFLVLNFINDSIHTLAHTKPFLPR
jgi:hypothetical protein